MSADVLWGTAGTPLTAEQQLARYAYALADVNQNRFLDLDAATPKTTEPIVTVSQGWAHFAPVNQRNRLIIVASLPLNGNYSQLAGKPWLRVAEIGTDAIPAAYGVV